jgi:plasmid replication initiation protein
VFCTFLITRKGHSGVGVFVYAVHMVWELLQFFQSGHEYASYITELAERLGGCPEEYSVLSVFKKEVGNHR